MDSTPSDLSQLLLNDNSVLSARFRCQQVPGIEGDLSYSVWYILLNSMLIRSCGVESWRRKQGQAGWMAAHA